MGPVTHTYSTQTDTAERITKGAEKRSGSLLREGQGVYERSSQPEQQNGDRGRSTGNNARAVGTAEFEREGDLSLSIAIDHRTPTHDELCIDEPQHGAGHQQEHQMLCCSWDLRVHRQY